MATVILISVLMAFVAAMALFASQAASPQSRQRDAARRRRFVERHPGQVNTGDIHRMLLEAGVSERDARVVMGKAGARQVRPLTMWLWIDRFDARTLALVLGADLEHPQILGHLGAGTLPDLDHLAVFASLNGLDLQAAGELRGGLRPSAAGRVSGRVSGRNDNTLVG